MLNLFLDVDTAGSWALLINNLLQTSGSKTSAKQSTSTLQVGINKNN